MLPHLQKLDTWLSRRLSFILLLLLLLVLRLPSLCEPYWYGDEGIYLTIGHALSQGSRLYSEIIDHKTPIIYYLAMVPNQFWFRVLLLGWMVAALGFFYSLAGKLFRHHSARVAATLVFVLLTNLPAFEGNIPNGELFVMGFVLAGGWVLSLTPLWNAFWSSGRPRLNSHSQPESTTHLNLELRDLRMTRQVAWLLVLAGTLFGLAILTKVPAVFDVAAFISVAWFSLSASWGEWLQRLFSGKKLRWQIFPPAVSVAIMEHALLVVAATASVIVLSVIYFVVRGSGADYLEYGLLYNFRYAGSWILPFDNPLLVFLFSLPGKVLLLALFLWILTLGRGLFSRRFQFIASWFALTLVASLLSNRPYPHYFLQVMPAIALILGLLWEGVQAMLESHWRRSSRTQPLTLNGSPVRTQPKPRTMISAAELGVGLALVCWFIAILSLMKVGTYPTVEYYQRWGRLLTGELSGEQYRNKFNAYMADNYKVAELLKPHANQRLFIWGTNPMLYALTQTIPTDKFTVAFHIKDFQSYDQSLEAIQVHRPKYIVVMNSDSTTFPALNEYLVDNYAPNSDFQHFVLWKEL